MEVCCAVPATPMMKAQKAVPATHLRIKSSRNRDYPFLFRPIYFKAAEQSSGLVGDDHVVEKPLHNKTVTQIKASLNLALQGINRGIFGVPSEKKSEIEGLVELLESQNPTTNPTQNLEKVSGCWKLVYSTITILGPKRTKLGLRDFITLGDFLQIIDVSEGKAVNVINFIVTGLKMFSGRLTIEASFTITSKSVKSPLVSSSIASSSSSFLAGRNATLQHHSSTSFFHSTNRR